MKSRLLFLTLNTFSATGGIEKVCRVAGKALHQLTSEEGGELQVFSMYDKPTDVTEPYIPRKAFRGFAAQRIWFVVKSIFKSRQCSTVLLSHINLLPVGFLIKKLRPTRQLILLAHGIEVWDTLPSWKQRMMKQVDLFLPVSAYTAQKLREVQKQPANKIKVLNNCLDPFLTKKTSAKTSALLRKKHGFSADDFVLFTLTRLKSSEQYKGYDKVIKALGALKASHPQVKYLIAGKYDGAEKKRLDALIAHARIESHVVFTGFLPDEEVAAHFDMADAYIMPSTGEGFGIVFIEALFYGKAVIAGNIDGSVDALAGGKFGLLVNPNRQEEICNAIKTVFQNKASFEPDNEQVQQYFGYQTYKQQWKQIYQKKPKLKTSSNKADNLIRNT